MNNLNELMINTHDLILTQSELQDIIDAVVNDKWFIQPAMLEQYGFTYAHGNTYLHKTKTFLFATLKDNKLTLSSLTINNLEFDIVNEVCLDVIMKSLGFQKTY